MEKYYERPYGEKHICYSTDIESFYKDLNGCKFSGITLKKVLELKCNSKQLNKLFNNEYSPDSTKRKYVKIMNMIKTNPTMYGIESPAHRYLLFMFAVDPTFEAAIIYGYCNNTKDIKEQMKNHFGLYDQNLILLESYYIKNFLSPNKKESLNEEINRRIYK